MTLELELLVNAWDNYKQHIVSSRPNTIVSFTPAEENFARALDSLIDEREEVAKINKSI